MHAGRWVAKTADARRFLALHGSLFADQTDQGHPLKTWDIGHNLLKAILLSLLPGSAQAFFLNVMSIGTLMYNWVVQPHNKLTKNKDSTISAGFDVGTLTFAFGIGLVGYATDFLSGLIFLSALSGIAFAVR